jgi:hypothetical protein
MTTDTPRTDAAEPQLHSNVGGWVRADFARQLERELALSLENQCKAQAEVERLRELLNRAIQIAEALKYSIETEFDAWSIPCRGVLEKYNTLKSDLARLSAAPEEASRNQVGTKCTDPVPTQLPTQNEWRDLLPTSQKEEAEVERLRTENVCLQELIQEFYEWSRRDYPTEAEVREIMNRYHDLLNK